MDTNKRSNRDLDEIQVYGCDLVPEKLQPSQLSQVEESLSSTKELKMKTKIGSLKAQNVSLQSKIESLQS